MRFESGQTVLFIGDSITDCGRGRPVGRGNQLGAGYVHLVHALLTATYPDQRIRVLNTGTSGNTVMDLKARWQTDVLDLAPDWLSVMIGINDVWRQFDGPLETESHVLPDLFEKTLQELIQSTPVKGLVLMTPYHIENNPHDDMRRRMNEYGAIVRKLAQKQSAILVDTQAAFDALLEHLPSEMIAGDRVHPCPAGHMVLARAFLDAVGYKWDA